MKRISIILIGLITLATAFSSCQDPINISPDSAPSKIAVEGWLYSDVAVQTIKLYNTTPYFNNNGNSMYSGATIKVTETTNGKVYNFKENAQGLYSDSMPIILGGKYTIEVKAGASTFIATSSASRVPAIDTLLQTKKDENIQAEAGYDIDMLARDFPGVGDYYRFRVFWNGKLLDDVNKISVTDDANTDALPFIPPIRFNLNPSTKRVGKDKNARYQVGDSVRVQILSIDKVAYNYMREFRTQLNNGGLFAQPVTNLPTNFSNTDPKGAAPVGLFVVSMVSNRTINILDKP